MSFVCVRRFAFCLVLVASLMITPAAEAQSYRMRTLEITGVDFGLSNKDDAAFGWWEPGKYDTWETDNKADFDLQGLRLTMPGEKYGVIYGWTSYPTISAVGTRQITPSSPTAETLVRADIEIYDLAFNMRYSFRDGSAISPIFGATFMAIDEKRQLVGSSDVDKAKTRLWGVIGGVEGDVFIHNKINLTGRILVRWGTGDRDARFIEDVSGSRVTLSDSIDLLMYNAELGFNWEFTTGLNAEAGWQYHNWENNRGPGTFDGLYLRLIVGF